MNKNEITDIRENEDDLYRQLSELIGSSVLVVTESAQLNLLGQTFRPIFCGPIVEVEPGHLTIYPANIKMINAPFFRFPTPLSIPFEKIAQFTPDFDCEARIPLI
ncbi:hypothetical protein [Peribacillus sp. SCS-155]|uniref:hypothetical protein n=1 Tax=Peribacillus sedimenti TaxID=3115297 RepID=UPI0039069D7B